ncbi:MAG: hypothetical protein JXA13_06120 [Anaerolineales bacterium]|nr:hypothetical protein [Anaerolineales bacterium]
MKLLFRIMSVFILAAMMVTLAPPAPRVSAASTCDWAQFIADVTVPDGTYFAPGTAFDKTWRLKNIGTCTWTTAYKLVFVSGSQMSAPAEVNLPKNVAPGETVDVTVRMTAPSTAGHYRGYWRLKNSSGVLFGIGWNANSNFWVEINVSSSQTSSSTYDFAAEACSATWTSSAGILPCSGVDGDARGFVIKQNNPKIENGTQDSRPGLLAAPQNVYNGYIQGVFPARVVQSGDRFQALVSCEYGAANCYVTFRLDYQINNGPVYTFWSFREKYEGLYYNVDLNLNSLAGQNVKFILTILSSGVASGDRAVWGHPMITNAGVTPVTPVVTVTGTPPTATATLPPSSCTDRATFISDVTVPDGSLYAAGTSFKKTWRLKNSGTCTWTTDYDLVFSSGEQMAAASPTAFPTTVAPGQTVDLSVDMTAPGAAGSYRGYWKLQNAHGSVFGIGWNANSAFWVDIRVTGSSSGGTPTSGTYDFYASACDAVWTNGYGQTLPCPGAEGNAGGFVLKQSSTKLENGTTSSSPGLLTMPQAVYNGYIRGTYPAFRVENGDRFQAMVNCEYGAVNCYVIFRLDYQIGSGPIYTYWSFAEKYEGWYYNADINLSSLAGQDVKFMLTILSAGYYSGDRALWVAPRIYRPGSGSVATNTPTVTATVPSSTAITDTPTVTPTVPTSTPTITLTPSNTPTFTPTVTMISGGAADTDTPTPTPTLTPTP